MAFNANLLAAGIAFQAATLPPQRQYVPPRAITSNLLGDWVDTQTKTASSSAEAPPVALVPNRDHPIQALIDGKTVQFPSNQQRVEALLKEWDRLCDRGSSVSDIINDAYGQIVAVGWEAITLLLREVQKQRNQWFEALTWITGVDLSTSETRGNARALRAAWIKWGTEHGFIA
jgi:hypothetical protein